MAPSPTTIPTSFVPKQPVQVGARFTQSGGNVFLTLSLILLAIALLAAGGVFGYERYLMSVRDAKALAVAEAEQNINASTVEEFIRTRDRFASAKELLNTHVAASNFFTLLETLTLQSVRFNSLSFILADDRSAEIRMEGTARTFNALAAQSSAYAGEKQIKRAIFSDIKVNENNTVSFSLAADLDAKLLLLTTPSAPASDMTLPLSGTGAASTTELLLETDVPADTL